MLVSVQTNIGMTRSVNQDSVFASTEPIGSLPNLFVIADGMGGHNGGEIASSAAISHFCDHIRSAGDASSDDNEKRSEDFLDLLTSAAHDANVAVLSQAENNPELSRMGTTLTACTINLNKCYIIHIGDSRVYVIEDNEITQLTHDHSYVNEMVKAGQITQIEAREHPKRNILTKVLGVNNEMSADGYIYDMKPDSVILLCSDGLYNMVPEDEIVYLIKNEPNDPSQDLVAAANKAGGTDNISVIVVRDVD